MQITSKEHWSYENIQNVFYILYKHDNLILLALTSYHLDYFRCWLLSLMFLD